MPWHPEHFPWIAAFNFQKRHEVCAHIISILPEKKGTPNIALAVAPTQPGPGTLGPPGGHFLPLPESH